MTDEKTKHAVDFAQRMAARARAASSKVQAAEHALKEAKDALFVVQKNCPHLAQREAESMDSKWIECEDCGAEVVQ